MLFYRGFHRSGANPHLNINVNVDQDKLAKVFKIQVKRDEGLDESDEDDATDFDQDPEEILDVFLGQYMEKVSAFSERLLLYAIFFSYRASYYDWSSGLP